MAKKTLRVGIIGYGWVAGAHITALNSIDGVSVAAVCSQRELSAETLSKKHGGDIAVHRDVRRMCDDPSLDIISICTAHPLHPEQAEIAARAGKHVIIEKPVALDPRGLDRVERAVTRAKVQAVICFEAKAAKRLQVIRTSIDRGLFGKLHYGECDYYHGIDDRYAAYGWIRKKASGGSSLLTAGCHAVDALIWMMDARPVEVMSYSARSAAPVFKAYGYPTTSATLIKFANGAVGKVASVIDAIQPYLFNIHLVGSRGAVWNDKFCSETLSGADRSGWATFPTPVVESADVADHAYRDLFVDFVAAIRTGGAQRFGFADGIRAHRVCLAADRSAATGKPVRVDSI